MENDTFTYTYTGPPLQPIYAPFFGVMGVSLSMIFSTLGASYATAKCGTGIAAMAVFKPQNALKALIPVVMAGIIAIYGLVVSVLITPKIEAGTYKLFTGFVHLGAGLAVGVSGLAAGYATGISGDFGVRISALQPKFFSGMILILIFASVPGLYGLITALVLFTKTK